MTRKPQRERRRTDSDSSLPAASSVFPDPFHQDATTASLEGVVAIHDVTREMMDAAARKAAEAADEMAHRSTAAAADAAHDAPAAGAAASPGQTTVPTDTTAAIADEVGQDAVPTGTGAIAALGRAVGLAEHRGLQDGGRPVGQSSSTADRDAGEKGLFGPAGAVVQYNAKLLDIIQANMAATGDLCAALMSAKSVPEIVALNVDHVGRQMDVITTQGRELASLAQKLALDALQPIRAMAASRFRAR